MGTPDHDALQAARAAAGHVVSYEQAGRCYYGTWAGAAGGRDGPDDGNGHQYYGRWVGYVPDYGVRTSGAEAGHPAVGDLCDGVSACQRVWLPVYPWKLWTELRSKMCGCSHGLLITRFFAQSSEVAQA